MAVILSALWLGILTSISPCPLASNIAAVSFLSRKIVHPGLVFLSGLAYTLGRMAAYSLLGFLIIGSLLKVPATANFLQQSMNALLGPVLIVSGLVLLDILKFTGVFSPVTYNGRKMLAEAGIAGAFGLGFIFALSFCPLSAALFFGSLIPLALKHPSGGVLPFIYGAATGLPVLAFAVAAACGARTLTRWFKATTRIEGWARKATGVVFLAVGGWYLFAYLIPILSCLRRYFLV